MNQPKAGAERQSQTAAQPGQRNGNALAPSTAHRDAKHLADAGNSRLQLIQKILRLSRIGTPILSIITASIFAQWFDPKIALLWAVAHASINFSVATLVCRIKTTSSDPKIVRQRLWMTGFILSLGNLAWTSMAVFFWVHGSIPNNSIICLLLASSLPHMIAITAASLQVYAISTLPASIGLLLRLLTESGPFHFSVAAMAIVYCMTMFAIVWQLHRTLTSMLQVKEHNADLLIQVARAKAESDAARYRAERLNQAKSTFLANMSHELRTPLNAILGFSEVISGEVLGPIGVPTYKEYASDIHTSGRHLLRLINDILDLSRIEAGRLALSPAILSVREIVVDAIKLVEGAAKKKNIRIECDLPSDLPNIKADERAMSQILVNLLSNAVKFTPAEGSIRVTAKPGTATFGASGMTIAVEDTGIGIKKEDLATVLEAFGQVRVEDLAMTAAREQGTGLGLPIVRGLIEAQGGRFALTSEVEVGTCASIELPPSCITWPESAVAAKAQTGPTAISA